MIILQLTGLSGAGKSTISERLSKLLRNDNYLVEILDGDVYRNGLCSDLGFSREDRNENIRRLAFVANRFANQGIISIMAAINPYESVRKEITEKYNNVITVWIKCSIEELIKRDTKGLYKRALLPDGAEGKINNLTGLNDPFEPPINPDLIIDTEHNSIEDSVNKIYKDIKDYLCSIYEKSDLKKLEV